MRVAVRVLVAAVVTAVSLVSGPPAVASGRADPGGCGVRSSGPTSVGAGDLFAYSVRNQCRYGMDMAVYLPSQRVHIDCKWVPALGYQHYFHPWPDPNWRIVIC